MKHTLFVYILLLISISMSAIQYEQVLNVPGATNFAWLDFDLDGDEDVIVTGNNVTNLYRNDGTAGFVNTGLPFAGFAEAEIHIADYNNDGYPDILISGYNTVNYDPEYDPFPFAETKVYTNNGIGGFTDVTIPLANVRDTKSAWFGSTDYFCLFISAFDENGNYLAKYYIYNTIAPNGWEFSGDVNTAMNSVTYRYTQVVDGSLYYLTSGITMEWDENIWDYVETPISNMNKLVVSQRLV